MIKKFMMTPATLKTIITTAPIIIQALDKALNMIRRKTNDIAASKETLPVTVEGLSRQIMQIEARLSDNFRSDEEQIVFIEQLVNQNKALAETLQQTYRKVTVLTYVAVLALVTSGIAMLLVINR